MMFSVVLPCKFNCIEMYENQSTLSDGGEYEQIVDGCTKMKLTVYTYVDTLRSTFFDMLYLVSSFQAAVIVIQTFICVNDQLWCLNMVQLVK